MQKRNMFMLAAVITIVLLLSSCGALFMSDEAKDLTGFWRSDDWNSSEDDSYTDTCYYDFQDDGRVYVTDYTDSMPFHNFWMAPMPIHFNYTVDDGYVKMSQYFGIAKFEFNCYDDFSADSITLSVISATGDYERFSSYGNTITLTRVIDYTEQDLAARALLRDYASEVYDNE